MLNFIYITVKGKGLDFLKLIFIKNLLCAGYL